MIRVNTHLQALVCDVCEEVVELRRATMGDPERLFLLREEMAREHTACEEFRHDPDRARRERDYRRRMKREFGKGHGTKR